MLMLLCDRLLFTVFLYFLQRQNLFIKLHTKAHYADTVWFSVNKQGWCEEATLLKVSE